MDRSRSGRRWAVPASALFVAAALGGCSSNGPQPVEGVVVWEDGSPATELANAQVVFDLPEKQTSARGSVRPDGTFRLTTFKPDDGALPGEYRKVMVLEVGRKTVPGDSTRLMPGVIDTRYADPSTTDLSATVGPGVNKITLKVKRAAKQ
jgi:hypothetical protein